VYKSLRVKGKGLQILSSSTVPMLKTQYRIYFGQLCLPSFNSPHAMELEGNFVFRASNFEFFILGMGAKLELG